MIARKSSKLIKCVFILLLALFIYVSHFSNPGVSLLKFDFFQQYNPNSSWSWSFTDAICKSSTTGICNDKFAHKAHFESFTKDKESFWRSISRSSIQNIQNGIKKHLEEFENSSIEKPAFKGRGIVFSSGAKSLRMVFISIKFIRGYGCNLPIEIWSYLTNQA